MRIMVAVLLTVVSILSVGLFVGCSSQKSSPAATEAPATATPAATAAPAPEATVAAAQQNNDKIDLESARSRPRSRMPV